MADIRINQLPTENNPVATENVAIDGATTRKTTIQKMVDVGAPVASQAEAEAGVNATKRMTPLTVKQSIASEVGVTVASASQGALASTALQPDNIPSIVDEAAAAAEGFANIAQAAANWNLVFSTRADAEAANIDPSITSIGFKGYYEPGDGGAWPYIVEIVEDGSPVLPWQVRTNGGTRRWALRTTTPNSRMFGAKADGVTLDTAAVQALMDYSAEYRVRGRVVAGTHLCRALYMPDNCHIYSDNKEGVIKGDAFLSPAYLLINKEHAGGGNSNITLDNLEIDLNGYNQTGRQTLFQFVGCTRVKVTNCLIKNARWPHLVFNACSFCEASFNEIMGGIGHGISVRSGSTDNNILFNHIHDIGPDNGYEFNPGEGFLRAYGIFLYDGSCVRNTLMGNRIINPNGHGICFGGNGTNELYDDNKVLDNYIADAGQRNTDKVHRGIWIIAARRNLIQGNTVTASGDDGIKLSSEAHRNIIKDNYVWSSGRFGIALDDADENTIEGNHVFNNGQKAANTYDGIAVGPFGQCLKNRIVGNYLYDSQTVKTQRYGLFETASPGSNNNLIRDNYAYDNISDAQISTRGSRTKSHRNFLTTQAGVELETYTFTANVTIAVAYKAVMINVTTARTLNLPVDYSIPDDYEVLLVDIGGNLATNNVTVNAPTGYTINGGTSFVMNQNNQRVRVVKVPGEKRFVTL